jgi:hypothetical protein
MSGILYSQCARLLQKPLACALTLALLPALAPACTLWSAAGEAAGGGTLLAKNRDWVPDHRQEVRVVRPPHGWAYVGLFALGNDDPGLKAGTNAQGLTIVSASSNIARKLRQSQPGMHGVMEPILRDYASVAAVLADAMALFSHARANFYMLSDSKQTMTVEVGLQGRFSIKQADAGTLAHTNHYLDAELAQAYNSRIGNSSATRLHRVTELLAQASTPATLQDFQRISQDQHDGPDNSLWRSGHAHTLATWLVQNQPDQAPHLHITLANPGEPMQHLDWVLDATFWATAP